MLSVVSMNDRSEINYADSYFENIIKVHAPINRRVKETIDVYILSCIEGEKDDLTMWRLYGEDSRGACIVYSIDMDLINNSEFILAPISYADKNQKHRELDLVYDMMTRDFKKSQEKAKLKFVFKRWDIWKHFFKPYDYHDEKEVRLLYKCNRETNDKKWILSNLNIFTPLVEFAGYNNEEKKGRLPLKIEKILLGPNSPERSLNIDILMKLMKEYQIPISIEQSTIDNYRL